MNKNTIGIIIGNRDFFPDHLISQARKDILDLFKKNKINPIILSDQETKNGGVETYDDAEKCSKLFKKNEEVIDGFLVVLPNFGDEKGIADTLKLSNMNLPVLVMAYPDELNKLDQKNRRDAFCGKISVCNNLYQYGIKYSLTKNHTIHPSDPLFEKDLIDFIAVFRVVKGIKKLRIGAIGARPTAFNTVRYSEKILERNGISVITADLSEILGIANKLTERDKIVKNSIEKIKAYSNIGHTPDDKLIQIAKLDAVLDQFVLDNKLDATAIQCWTSVQQNYGCNVCTSMSIMSENMLPSACEVDVTGTVTMYAMQLASSSPSALVDWNNNYADNDDKCVLFHCGNWAKSFLPDVKLSTAPILGTIVGEENTFGALEGRTPASELTFGRISTDDNLGKMKGYFGEGKLTDDPLNTFGTRAVAEVPNLQKLMNHICNNGFEHHVVMNASSTVNILKEACSNYLNWEIYHHI